MQSRQLTVDTDANVCISCGRDDIPRRQSTTKDREEDVKAVEVVGLYQVCKLCHREIKTYGGVCSRCRYRMDKGLEPV